MRYTSVDIIFNPNSTGPSAKYAKELKRELKKRDSKLVINLQKTEYAGHAETIAYQCAKATNNPLIISSSGDGGYNEVVNGAIAAQLEGGNPVCAILAAGNANDHSRTLQEQPLLEAILSNKVTSLDLLKATISKDGNKKTRYAHSYIGLGLTPIMAVELNKTNLNALNEMWIVLKTFYKFRPFKIKRGKKTVTLDSILFSNIGEMAKVLTVAKDSKPDDGLFEVVTFPHASKLKLVHKLAKATTVGLEKSTQSKDYNFEVLKKMPAQFDGEVEFIAKNSTVRITNERRILKTII